MHARPHGACLQLVGALNGRLDASGCEADVAPLMPLACRTAAADRRLQPAASLITRPVDAISLLKQDHREVKQLFQAFERTEDDTEKQDLANRICDALNIHAQIEEEIFYPSAYDALDEEGDDLLDEAEVEHSIAKI